MTELLRVRGLVVRFYSRDGVVHAVNDVSYSMDKAETLGIVGESGCGKTVQALSIMGLVSSPPGRIEGGEIWFSDRNLLTLREEEMQRVRGAEIAMVFQDPMTSLNPVLTVGLQIAEALRFHMGMDSLQARERAVELLTMVGIPEADVRSREYPHEFSGGMRQRVMIAMALSCSPKLLIADEPTTALDVTIQAQIVDLVKRLQDVVGMAVMWITHDLRLLADLARRIVVMYAGQIVEKGTVRDIYRKPRHPYTLGLIGSLPRLDEEPGAKLQAIPGSPPNLLDWKPGCPFAARCSYSMDQCMTEAQLLQEVEEGPEHLVACWRWRIAAKRNS